jgi:hypothetical protein
MEESAPRVRLLDVAPFALRFNRNENAGDRCCIARQWSSQTRNLPRISGDPSWTVPMPGRYVIGTDGVVAYTRRPDPGTAAAGPFSYEKCAAD